MEIRTAYSDTMPLPFREGYGIILITTHVTPYSYSDIDGTVTGFSYTEYALSPTEYHDIQYGYFGDDPVLRIVYLKHQLAETDYIAAKLAEADAEEEAELREHYAEVLEFRKGWREEIRRLEQL